MSFTGPYMKPLKLEGIVYHLLNLFNGLFCRDPRLMGNKEITAHRQVANRGFHHRVFLKCKYSIIHM